MINHLRHALIGFLATLIGGALFGYLLVNTGSSLTRVVGLVLGSAWLVLGFLAWRDSRRPDAEKYRTPETMIYGLRPPPTYVSDRQYPPRHWQILEKGPQSPLE